jgi:hypothetical protein
MTPNRPLMWPRNPDGESHGTDRVEALRVPDTVDESRRRVGRGRDVLKCLDLPSIDGVVTRAPMALTNSPRPSMSGWRGSLQGRDRDVDTTAPRGRGTGDRE